MSLLRFVPEYCPPSTQEINEFVRILKTIKNLVVMTGAGISTESGIPDYRSPKVGQFARTNHRPLQHQEFMESLNLRRRYWSRNYVAWPRFDATKPNETHQMCAAWEARSDRFGSLITQNVDGLHTKAGSRHVIELHGNGTRVICMRCRTLYSRKQMQEWLADANPNWTIQELGELAPDGDCDIPDSAVANFNVPYCPSCGPKSILKTDVVFFGGFVPAAVHEECARAMALGDGMLVLGSSLLVMTGYRYVDEAHRRGMPILIGNIGQTAADHLATCKLSAKCSDICKHVCDL